MNKRIIFTILSIVIILILASCGNVEPISPNHFEQTMTNEGYTVIDVSHQVEGDHLELALLAISAAQTYQFELYVFVSDDEAAFFFQNVRNRLESDRENPHTQSAVSLQNLERYELTSGGNYAQLLRRANTALVVIVEESRRDSVRNIISVLEN